MSVAHDLDLLAEEKRKEEARKLVSMACKDLQRLRQRTRELESGDLGTWHDARFLAQDLIRTAHPLELTLLVACAKEVLIFVERRFNGESLLPELSFHMLCALDTLGMELERLRNDRDLR